MFDLSFMVYNMMERDAFYSASCWWQGFVNDSVGLLWNLPIKSAIGLPRFFITWYFCRDMFPLRRWWISFFVTSLPGGKIVLFRRHWASSFKLSWKRQQYFFFFLRAQPWHIIIAEKWVPLSVFSFLGFRQEGESFQCETTSGLSRKAQDREAKWTN